MDTVFSQYDCLVWIGIPVDLKEEIEKAAFINNRSINAEAVYRLRVSFLQKENDLVLENLDLESQLIESEKIDQLFEFQEKFYSFQEIMTKQQEEIFKMKNFIIQVLELIPSVSEFNTYKSLSNSSHTVNTTFGSTSK